MPQPTAIYSGLWKRRALNSPKKGVREAGKLF